MQGAPSELKITFDDSLYGSLTRSDVLLRDPFTAEPVPKKRWSFGVVESNGQTELIVKVKGRQPPGMYQLQINPGKIADDSGNTNPKRIRHNFQSSNYRRRSGWHGLAAPAMTQATFGSAFGAVRGRRRRYSGMS